MGVIDSILGQFKDVGLEDRELVQIRVTPDAIPGSLVGMAITPERARTMGRESDHGLLVEIVVNPQDWDRIQAEMPGLDSVQGDLSQIYGVPVITEDV